MKAVAITSTIAICTSVEIIGMYMSVFCGILIESTIPLLETLAK